MRCPDVKCFALSAEWGHFIGFHLSFKGLAVLEIPGAVEIGQGLHTKVRQAAPFALGKLFPELCVVFLFIGFLNQN